MIDPHHTLPASLAMSASKFPAFKSSALGRLPAIAALALCGLALGGCGSLDRLSNVGRQPDLTAIQDPTAQPGYKPVRMPMPTPQPVSYAANSLWRTGSRGFFKDQRAQQVGDILTVAVKVTDKANLDNENQAFAHQRREVRSGQPVRDREQDQQDPAGRERR